MDISPARLTSLLKEALTPHPVPSAKADPAIAALVKALVRPPAPPAVPSAQFAAQALNGSLPRQAPDMGLRLASGEVEHAYRAIMETELDAEGTPARALAGRPAIDGDRAPRGPALVQVAVAEGTATIAAAPALPLSAVAVSQAGGIAAYSNARPHGDTRRDHAPRSEPSKAPPRTMSIVTAIVSAAAVTILLVLLR